MADKKISDFATLTDVQSNDLLLVSSLNETYNAKVETFMESIKEDGIVLFDTAQSLTTQEKQQARTNIGAADDSNSVHVNDTQSLTDQQKATARGNIGALAVNQGVAQAGKALVVDDNGNVAVGEAGIPDNVKSALLNLVRHVAYIDDDGQTYYDVLYSALYSTTPPEPEPEQTIEFIRNLGPGIDNDTPPKICTNIRNDRSIFLATSDAPRLYTKHPSDDIAVTKGLYSPIHIPKGATKLHVQTSAPTSSEYWPLCYLLVDDGNGYYNFNDPDTKIIYGDGVVNNLTWNVTSYNNGNYYIYVFFNTNNTSYTQELWFD